MVFSSTPFLYYFLPLVCIFYFILPRKFKNFCLLSFSFLFYFLGEPRYIVVMIISTLVAFLFGFLIDKADGKKRKLYLTLSLVLNFLPLLFFKYTDFFIGNLNVLGLGIPLLKLVLPIGISFYTFQLTSYTIDLYRKNVAVQRNFINFACYIALFPQLIAGPIVRYSIIADQLENRKHTMEKTAEGVFRFCVGLLKKVMIANVLGEFTALAGENLTGAIFWWLSAIAYSLQIYFDFSGYSDMAIGLGKIFGFDFEENFNYPFISKTIAEFWRRWHISLGSWFRDYVYIPMGGNRVSAYRWLFNILTVWFLTGFWHGASWNFILWGLYFAFFLVAEKLVLNKILKKLPSFVSHIYVIFFIIISFVIFKETDFSLLFNFLYNMGNLLAPLSKEATYYITSYLPTIIIAIIGSTPIMKKLSAIITKKGGEKVLWVLKPVFVLAVLIIVTAFSVDGSFNPFLYFRF